MSVPAGILSPPSIFKIEIDVYIHQDMVLMIPTMGSGLHVLWPSLSWSVNRSAGIQRRIKGGGGPQEEVRAPANEVGGHNSHSVAGVSGTG